MLLLDTWSLAIIRVRRRMGRAIKETMSVVYGDIWVVRLGEMAHGEAWQELDFD